MNLLGWDEQIYRAIHVGLPHTPLLDSFFLNLTNTGEGWGQAAVAVLAIVIPYLVRLFKVESKNPAVAQWIPHSPRLGYFALACWAVASLTRFPVMDWIHRQRPSNFIFAHPLQPYYADTSFPSGHTTSSFALAIATALFYKGTSKRWVGYLALTWSTLVGFSRIYLGVHYPFDVLGGVAYATIWSCLVYLEFNRRGWLAVPVPSIADEPQA